MSTSVVYVGLDVHKDSITIAVAREGREAAENWKTIPYDGFLWAVGQEATWTEAV